MAIRPPSFRTTTPDLRLPERISRLADLAYNLWWSWHEPARGLFWRLGPNLWELTDRSPVTFLKHLPAERLAWAAGDPDFLAAYDAVIATYDRAMGDGAGTWTERFAPELNERLLAYFSAEFGLHPALPIYSGGLGVLSGDHMKEASDLGLPTVGVSLLYRQGYLRQRLDASGWQQDVTADFGPYDEPTTQVLGPDGQPLMINIDFAGGGGPLRLGIWRVQVGRVPILLLDSDLDGNPDWTRTISSRLYGGDREHRLRQEIMLGIGGVRALRALGIAPDYWHANEGHAAFHLLERISEHVRDGATFDEAAGRVRDTTVFTSHTPVPAGHDIFSAELMDRYFATYWPDLGLDREAFLGLGRHGGDPGFNLTALSLRLAEHRNGVSEKHGEITREMWRGIWAVDQPGEVPITSITNGVHHPTWISRWIRELLDAYLEPDWLDRMHDPIVWQAVDNIPDGVFWNTHQAAKTELLQLLRRRLRLRWVKGEYDQSQIASAGPFLERDALTLGFARRFATYKRATLIFQDQERLARILTDLERPVQIIFAGKAHPADEGGKRLIQEIYHHARDPKFGGRIAFAEDYDMRLASRLVAGVDVWLNNPRAPLEASGTSGMKASANGAPNLSILDGWWIEGYRAEPRNGWGLDPSHQSGAEQDREEAEAIYQILEQQVVPLYYRRGADNLPHDWIAVCKEAMKTVGPQFSMRRMVTDYMEQLYLPAAAKEVVRR